MFTILITAWVALATAAISPGPNLVAVASRSLGSGRLSGVSVAVGLGLGAVGWALVASAGLGTVFTQFPAVLHILGIGGGCYLIWLGIKGWRAALASGHPTITATTGHGVWRDMIHGLTVTATNPKVALLWASLATFVQPATQAPLYLLVFAGVSGAIIFGIYGTFGLLFSNPTVRAIYLKYQNISEATFGSIFLFLGCSLILRVLKQTLLFVG